MFQVSKNGDLMGFRCFYSLLFIVFFHGIVTVIDFKGFSWDLLMDFQWDVQ